MHIKFNPELKNSLTNLWKVLASFFSLLVSDAAKYMIAAGITLKSLYPKLFYLTCVTHLLHNCAMKIKSHFEDVDQLFVNVKAITIKKKQIGKILFYWLPTSACFYKMGKLIKCCFVLRKKFAWCESNVGKFCRFWNFGNLSKV